VKQPRGALQDCVYEAANSIAQVLEDLQSAEVRGRLAQQQSACHVIVTDFTQAVRSLLN